MNYSTFRKDFLTASVSFLIVYCLLIFRFGPFTDEIWDLSTNNHDWYIGCGRWAVVVYRHIMSEMYVPIAYGIAAAFFWGTTICIQFKLFEIQSKYKLLYIALSVGIVQLSYMMICAFITDAILFGMALIHISYYIIAKSSISNLIIKYAGCIVCVFIALSFYQTLAILLPFILLARYIINRNKSNSEWVSEVFKITVIGSIGTLLYFITKHISFHFADPQAIKAAQSYQAGLVTWGQLDLVTHVLHLGKQTVEHWLGLTYRSEWIFTTCLIPAAVLAWETIRAKKQVLMGLGCLAGLYVLPFASLWALGEDAGARLHFAQPFVAGILWVAALQRNRVLARIPQTVLIGISAFIILKASYTVCEMAFLQKRMHEDDVRRIQAVQQRAWLTPVPEGVDVFTCPIVVVGEQDFHVPDDFKSCVRFCGSVNGRRWLYDYLGMKGMKDIRESSTPREEVRELVKTMPLYPASGCTMYYKGEIIVNFNDAPPKKKEAR